MSPYESSSSTTLKANYFATESSNEKATEERDTSLNNQIMGFKVPKQHMGYDGYFSVGPCTKM